MLCPTLCHTHQRYKLKVLFYCLVTVRRGIRQRAEAWLGVLETVYGIHITTASMIDSNVTHVFLQQFKWSPRVNRQRWSPSQGELTHNTLKHLKRNSHTKAVGVPRFNSPIRTPTAPFYLKECVATSNCCFFYSRAEKQSHFYFTQRTTAMSREEYEDHRALFNEAINKPTQDNLWLCISEQEL